MHPWRSGTFILFSLIGCVWGWNNEDLALYDLVEEVNQNFYEFFSISQDATTQEVKKAYRRLSLEWHPDRNQAENASEKFRQVVGVYEVLKDKEMREKYDNVVEFGLPNWRSGVYYYRHYRKMGWAEALGLLFLIFSGAHYLMLWGHYFEQTLVEKQRRVKSKKGDKKTQKEMEEEEEERVKNALLEHRPSWRKSLPVLLCQFSLHLITSLLREAKERATAKPDENQQQEEEEPIRRRPIVPLVRMEPQVVQVAEMKAVVNEMPEELLKPVEEEKIIQEGVWSSAEMAELVKLATSKFPPGSALRWQHIAKALGRSVEDVTAAVKRIKHFQASEELSARQSIKVEDRTGEWSQDEQKLLEASLLKYPKGTAERWDRIAEAIPGRTKAEVVERFKQLAELVKAKKEKTAT